MMEQLDSERAKAVVRQYFHRLLNEKDLLVCDELLAPDYVDHDAPARTLPGPESTKTFVAAFLEEFPDMRVSIEDILAEGDRVAARIVWRGTNKDSGEEYHQMGIAILRLNAAGQLVERWSAYTSV